MIDVERILIARFFIRRVAAWFQHRKGQELDDISAEQIGAAVRLLYGTQHARRKRQRKRRHVTYRQRDGIAWLLIQLQQQRRGSNTMAMTRNDWTKQFREHVAGMGPLYSEADIADAAEERANDQLNRTGTDDAAMWQNPQAGAQALMNEWNAEEVEAAGAPQPGDAVTPEHPNAPGKPAEPGKPDDPGRRDNPGNVPVTTPENPDTPDEGASDARASQR